MFAKSHEPRYLSKAEFGRQKGVGRSMVSKWVAIGLPVTADGRVEYEAASEWLDRCTVRKTTPLAEVAVPAEWVLGEVATDIVIAAARRGISRDDAEWVADFVVIGVWGDIQVRAQRGELISDICRMWRKCPNWQRLWPGSTAPDHIENLSEEEAR